MRKWLFILVLLGIIQTINARNRVKTNSIEEFKYELYGRNSSLLDMKAYGNEHENILTLRCGRLWIQDQYLSPLLYVGHQVSLRNEWWQGFANTPTKVRLSGRQEYNHTLLNRKIHRDNWRHVGRFHANLGLSYNEAYTNSSYSLGINGGWGAYYNWRWVNCGIELLIGPYLELDWKSKLQGANINKPYSTDLAMNLCGMGGVNWSIDKRGMSIRVRYLAQMNLIGAEYMPDYWQSYYEMLEGALGKIQFSSALNHRHLQHELTLDMQFKHSTWRVGVAHSYLEYGSRKMRFSNEEVSVIMGCIWNYRTRTQKSLAAW